MRDVDVYKLVCDLARDTGYGKYEIGHTLASCGCGVRTIDCDHCGGWLNPRYSVLQEACAARGVDLDLSRDHEHVWNLPAWGAIWDRYRSRPDPVADAICTRGDFMTPRQALARALAHVHGYHWPPTSCQGRDFTDQALADAEKVQNYLRQHGFHLIRKET